MKTETNERNVALQLSLPCALVCVLHDILLFSEQVEPFLSVFVA
jgi:hypothetical protein